MKALSLIGIAILTLAHANAPAFAEEKGEFK